MPDVTEKKFSELETAGVFDGSEFAALSQTTNGELMSVKATLQAIANWFAINAQYTSALNTTSKNLTGAINELKQLISLIPQFSIEVVQTLPTEDISETTIYLVPNSDPEVGNYYEEYIYVNNAWELLGTTAVDLSGYYTALQCDAKYPVTLTNVAASSATTKKVADITQNGVTTSLYADDAEKVLKKVLNEEHTVTGNPISFDAWLGLEVTKECEVAFSPIQSGSGDPSPENIRPISGWTELNVARYGINLATTTIYKQGYVLNSDGTETVSTNYCITEKVPVNGGSKYILRFKENSGTLTDTSVRIGYYDSDGTFISRNAPTNETPALTVPNNTAFVCFSYVNNSSSNNYKWDLMYNEGETPLDYVPYQGTTHTATFSDTVYGGKWLPQEGKAIINTLFAEYDGTEEGWSETTSSGNHIVRIAKPSGTKGNDSTISIANFLVRTTNSEQITQNKYYLGSTNLAVGYSDTLENWKAYIGTNHLQVVYELATPTEITLTAQEIELLKGQNVLFTDGDNIKLVYSCDIKQWVLSQLQSANE